MFSFFVPKRIKCFLKSHPGLHQERTDDLLHRIKADLPPLKKWLLDAREREIEVVFRGDGFEAAHAADEVIAKGLLDIVGGETDADAGADGLRW